jgi:hypothetical protein
MDPDPEHCFVDVCPSCQSSFASVHLSSRVRCRLSSFLSFCFSGSCFISVILLVCHLPLLTFVGFPVCFPLLYLSPISASLSVVLYIFLLVVFLFSLLTLLVLFHEWCLPSSLFFMIGPVVLPVCLLSVFLDHCVSVFSYYLPAVLLSSPPCMLFVLRVILPAFCCSIFFAFCSCRVYSSLPLIRLVCFRGLKLFFCKISLPLVFHFLMILILVFWSSGVLLLYTLPVTFLCVPFLPILLLFCPPCLSFSCVLFLFLPSDRPAHLSPVLLLLLCHYVLLLSIFSLNPVLSVRHFVLTVSVISTCSFSVYSLMHTYKRDRSNKNKHSFLLGWLGVSW